MELILGSQSPRRRELLERMGLRFRVLTADIDETKFETEDPEASVRRICREKAAAVAKAFPLGGRCPSAHTGADEGTYRRLPGLSASTQNSEEGGTMRIKIRRG